MATMADHLRVAYDDPYWSLWDSFELDLNARGRSPATVRIYRHAVTAFRQWLEAEGAPLDPAKVTKREVQGFIADQLATRSQATARSHFGGLRSWFVWMEAEEIIERSPMHRMAAPKVNDKPTDMLSPEQIAALFKACSGPSFEDRRDAAMFRLFLDTGLRREEMARLAVEDVDIRSGMLRVKIKGGDTEIAPFGTKAARDLDRYLRARARHRLASMTIERRKDQGGRETELVHPLWLSPQGQFSGAGLYAALRRRAAAAGIDPKTVHPHQLRHGFADALKRGGASDEDVQRLGRWKDPKMVRRYGAALSQQRAFDTHRRLSPGDRV